MALALSACATVQDKPPQQLPPGEASALRLSMAAELVKQRDYDKALPYLKGLRKQHPDVSAVRRLLGVVLREKGMPRAAERELKLAIKLGPRDPEAYSALAVLHDKQGRHKVAEKLHREALDLNDEVARYHNNLGFCLFLQKDLDDAEDAVKDAIRIDPGMRVAYNNLGFILGMSDRGGDALEAFKQAGDQAQALTNMGLLEEMKGKPASARRYYEKALSHRRDYKPALENLKALQPQVQQGEGAEPPSPTETNEKAKGATP